MSDPEPQQEKSLKKGPSASDPEPLQEKSLKKGPPASDPEPLQEKSLKMGPPASGPEPLQEKSLKRGPRLTVAKVLFESVNIAFRFYSYSSSYLRISIPSNSCVLGSPSRLPGFTFAAFFSLSVLFSGSDTGSCCSRPRPPSVRIHSAILVLGGTEAWPLYPQQSNLRCWVCIRKTREGETSNRNNSKSGVLGHLVDSS